MATTRIGQYMSRSPTTISPHDSLSAARQKMREHLVHHLPVLDGDSVMGMLSDRDVEVAESVGGPSGFDGTTVAAVMTRHPYVVEPDAPLEQVVQELVARRYGSALVVSGGQVVGIFTGTDALQAFADVLTGRIPKPMD